MCNCRIPQRWNCDCAATERGAKLFGVDQWGRMTDGCNQLERAFCSSQGAKNYNLFLTKWMYLSPEMVTATAIVKTVNTLYRDSDNLSAAEFRDYFVGFEIIPVTWPEYQLTFVMHFFLWRSLGRAAHVIVTGAPRLNRASVNWSVVVV